MRGLETVPAVVSPAFARSSPDVRWEMHIDGAVGGNPSVRAEENEIEIDEPHEVGNFGVKARAYSCVMYVCSLNDEARVAWYGHWRYFTSKLCLDVDSAISNGPILMKIYLSGRGGRFYHGEGFEQLVSNITDATGGIFGRRLHHLG